MLHDEPRNLGRLLSLSLDDDRQSRGSPRRRRPPPRGLSSRFPSFSYVVRACRMFARVTRFRLQASMNVAPLRPHHVMPRTRNPASCYNLASEFEKREFQGLPVSQCLPIPLFPPSIIIICPVVSGSRFLSKRTRNPARRTACLRIDVSRRPHLVLVRATIQSVFSRETRSNEVRSGRWYYR